MSKYDDYVEAQHAAGEDPLGQAEWRKLRLAEGREAAASKRAFEAALATAVAVEPENLVVAEPEPEPALEAPDRVIFWCEYRYGVQVMQAGRKIVVNNQLVNMEHRTIEFNEHHWTADMHNPDHVEKVEWLRHCDDLRRGRIVEVPDFRPVAQRVQVRTGPRVTGDRIVRPPAPASPAAALTAPLT